MRPLRAWLSQGKVVKMTPRALARFQTIPDDYELPDSPGLACKGIGNAVPPLLYRNVIEQIKKQLTTPPAMEMIIDRCVASLQ
jgi:site-specific DNA-cytosine methylase